MKAFIHICFIEMKFFIQQIKNKNTVIIYLFLTTQNLAPNSPFVDNPEKFVYNFF